MNLFHVLYLSSPPLFLASLLCPCPVPFALFLTWMQPVRRRATLTISMSLVMRSKNVLTAACPAAAMMPAPSVGLVASQSFTFGDGAVEHGVVSMLVE